MNTFEVTENLQVCDQGTSGGYVPPLPCASLRRAYTVQLTNITILRNELTEGVLILELGTHSDWYGRGKVVRGLAGKMRQAVVVVRSKVAVAARSNEAASRMQASKPRQLAVAYQGN